MNTHLFQPAADFSEHANEWKVVCAASRVACSEGQSRLLHELIENQAAAAIDWDALLSLADQHGVSSLLCQNLAPFGRLIPPSAMNLLQQRYDSNLRKSLLLASELIRILDCSESLGIELMAYKGITLAEIYYGDMALRPAGDIDLFVAERDVLRMKAALSDLGFAPRSSVPAARERPYVDSGYEWAFGNSAGQNLLELQWRLQPRFYAVDYGMDGLFARALNAKIADRPVRVPAAEDLLLVLSLHAAKHAWGRLIWLCDIAQVLKCKDLNWDWIQRQTRELGIARILHVTVSLATNLLGASIPTAIEADLKKDRAVRAFTERITESMIAGVYYEEQKISYFRLMMSLRERRSDRMRFFTRLAFTPGPGEWNLLQLPNPLLPLYRVVRLGRLAARFARS